MAKTPIVPPGIVRVQPDPWNGLRRFTPARIGLGRTGGSLPTKPLLEFQLAHARARDAVHRELDVEALREKLAARQFDTLALASAAGDRHTFIQRPDLGRILDENSKTVLEARPQ